MIKVAAPFWRTGSLTLVRPGKEDLIVPTNLVTEQRYNYQARAVMECLRQGKLENEVMPWDKTLEIMRMLDQIRAQVGLKYPMEK